MEVQDAQWVSPHQEPGWWHGCLQGPSSAHHCTDLEKASGEEIHADETELPGACPAGLLGELSGELHGVRSPRLPRAKDRLSLGSISRSVPTPCETLLTSPQHFFPWSLHLQNPPSWLHLLPNFPRSRSSLHAALALNLGYLPHPTGPPEDGASPPATPSTQAFSRSHTRVFKVAQIPWSLPLLPLPPPPDLQKQKEDTDLKGPQNIPFLSFT